MLTNKRGNIPAVMEYIVHGSMNQNDSDLLWSEFVEMNEQRFDLLLQVKRTNHSILMLELQLQICRMAWIVMAA